VSKAATDNRNLGVRCGHISAADVVDLRVCFLREGDAENRIVGGRERHTRDTQMSVPNTKLKLNN
jgi:hypothetical protein